VKKIKTYITELTIVTVGVLIALVISNFNESNQAREYQITSMETIKNEVEANHSVLKGILEKQTTLLDSITKYIEGNVSLFDLLRKAGGLKSANLSNTGLEFYKRNQINSIDFEIMSTLIQMNMKSELINMKLEKFMDFLYPNLFVDSKESKMIIRIHLLDIIGSEKSVMQLYENFIQKNISTTHNPQ